MNDPDGLRERIYFRLKSDVSRGVLSAHLRLDYAELAGRYEVSTTPVREAAMRLLGEGLLDVHPKGGLRPSPATAAELAGMLDLHAQLTAVALRWLRSDAIELAAQGTDTADRARQIFTSLAHATGNAELTRIMARLEDRLERYRRHDQRLLPDVDAELTAIVDAAPVPRLLAKLLRRYHQRRLRIAPQAVLLASTEVESS